MAIGSTARSAFLAQVKPNTVQPRGENPGSSPANTLASKPAGGAPTAPAAKSQPAPPLAKPAPAPASPVVSPPKDSLALLMAYKLSISQQMASQGRIAAQFQSFKGFVADWLRG